MFISDCLQTESNTFIINNIHILRLLDHLINLFIILLAHKLLISLSVFLTPNMLSFSYIIFSKYNKTFLWNYQRYL